MASSTPAAAIDLSTPQDRPFVRIDRIDYDVRVLDDFTAAELHQLDRLLPRVIPLVRQLETQTLTADECEELIPLLGAILALALVAPPSVLERLGDIDKVRVFQVFYLALASRPREPKPTSSAEPVTWDQAVARLQRFYRGEIAAWSLSVPMGMVNRLLAQIPRLEAEESIAATVRTSIGSGLGDVSTRERVWGEWQRAALSNRQPSLEPKQKGYVSPGMKVIAVPKKSATTTRSQETTSHAAST